MPKVRRTARKKVSAGGGSPLGGGDVACKEAGGCEEQPVPKPPEPPSEEERKCSICLDQVFRPVTASCCHCFCRLCLVRWLSERPNCPLCRARADVLRSDGVSSRAGPEGVARESQYARHRLASDEEYKVIRALCHICKTPQLAPRLTAAVPGVASTKLFSVHLKSLALLGPLRLHWPRLVEEFLGSGEIGAHQGITLNLAMVNMELCGLGPPYYLWPPHNNNNNNTNNNHTNNNNNNTNNNTVNARATTTNRNNNDTRNNSHTTPASNPACFDVATLLSEASKKFQRTKLVKHVVYSVNQHAFP